MPDRTDPAERARRDALRKAQEILSDHIQRYGEFTAEELAEGQAAWTPPGQAATSSEGP